MGLLLGGHQDGPHDVNNCEISHKQGVVRGWGGECVANGRAEPYAGIPKRVAVALMCNSQ